MPPDAVERRKTANQVLRTKELRQMTFDPIDFEQLNESDVREEVIAPLLRRLGYRSGTVNNIIREQSLSLRYPKAFLGRKKPTTDPVLRGKADYICEVEGPIRWVIEAKPPSSDFGLDEIQQAFTYANHPEVRAALFCLCNGQELRIFQTNLGPDSNPILTVQYSELEQRFNEIETLLAPSNFKSNFPTYTVDPGPPLGPALRSIARVTGGKIQYTKNSANLVMLKDYILTITGGAIERNRTGQMVVTIKTSSAFDSLQKLNEKVGLVNIEATSDDSELSSDVSKPTRFVSYRSAVFPQGEKVLDISTWREIVLPTNINIQTATVAEGVLKGRVFQGSFGVNLNVAAQRPFYAEGVFEIHLS